MACHREPSAASMASATPERSSFRLLGSLGNDQSMSLLSDSELSSASEGGADLDPETAELVLGCALEAPRAQPWLLGLGLTAVDDLAVTEAGEAEMSNTASTCLPGYTYWGTWGALFGNITCKRH